MVTSGMDAMLKVWDVRTYQPLHSLHIRKPAAAVSISQRGMVATGHGKHCQVKITLSFFMEKQELKYGFFELVSS